MKINQTLQAQKKGSYSIYFESLNTGAWIGLNEKKTFVPASLLKVPVVAAIFKKIQEGNLTLASTTTVQPQDINYLYGSLGLVQPGDQLTVQQLINYTLYYSDNTAVNILVHFIENKDILDSYIGMGLPANELKNLNTSSGLQLSAKDYSNILRSLYYSSYLRRAHSQYILSYLSVTNFHDGLPAGLPSDIKISHKIGYYPQPSGDQHHDCGIIYYPNAPYILCIMTQGLNQGEADQFTAEISKMTYDYIKDQTDTPPSFSY